MSFSLMMQHRDAGRQKCKDGRYDEAEQLFQMALREAEGESSPNVYEARQLKTLGVFYFARSRFGEAEPLFKRSLEIEKSLLGPHDLEICKSLNHLGLLYQVAGQFYEAEKIYKQAIQILEKAPFQKNPSVDSKLHHLSLHLLAMVYCSLGRQDEAFELCMQASQEIGRYAGPGGKDISMGIHDVAVKYCDNDPDPEVRKTCGWLLQVFFEQLQTEFLGAVVQPEDRKYREIKPKKGTFADTHEVLAEYDEAWRPASIYRSDTLPEGFRQSKQDASSNRLTGRMSEMEEEQWRP
ncbi:MAG: tetratricopeptide repeat protein [Candidatus Omnitrophica bacterium]|nr:tetratricopeptide repeat protein [Candidatus Omnitrophota bacterium]